MFAHYWYTKKFYARLSAFNTDDKKESPTRNHKYKEKNDCKIPVKNEKQSVTDSDISKFFHITKHTKLFFIYDIVTTRTDD